MRLFLSENFPLRISPLRSDRNWLEFVAVLEAAFWDVTSTSESSGKPSDEAKTSCKEQIQKAREVFTSVSEKDGPKDRSGPLALLDLEQRATKLGLSSGGDFLRFDILPGMID